MKEFSNKPQQSLSVLQTKKKKNRDRAKLNIFQDYIHNSNGIDHGIRQINQ